MFHTASPDDVLEGRITDVYFDRTMKILTAKGINPVVRAEFIAKSFPGDWPWAVFAGIDEALYVLEKLPVRVRALREGTVLYPYEPVMEIEGDTRTSASTRRRSRGLICQASGVATKAARFKKLAGERPVISFGARRMHPLLAPMIERNAYIGGCDGVSVVKSGEVIGEDPMGTMPHALIICMGSTVEAIRAYDEVLDPKLRRVALIDTFLDEKFEVLNVAEALGERLYAVRFGYAGIAAGELLPYPRGVPLGTRHARLRSCEILRKRRHQGRGRPCAQSPRRRLRHRHIHQQCACRRLRNGHHGCRGQARRKEREVVRQKAGPPLSRLPERENRSVHRSGCRLRMRGNAGRHPCPCRRQRYIPHRSAPPAGHTDLRAQPDRQAFPLRHAVHRRRHCAVEHPGTRHTFLGVADTPAHFFVLPHISGYHGTTHHTERLLGKGPAREKPLCFSCFSAPSAWSTPFPSIMPTGTRRSPSPS
ncbi:MAG: nicotinate phosphoribosyltransferase [Desulfobacterales bacterium]|nr:nicotinate phosphoribosyltransferase [Desulfobacterales bacterium]